MGHTFEGFCSLFDTGLHGSPVSEERYEAEALIRIRCWCLRHPYLYPNPPGLTRDFPTLFILTLLVDSYQDAFTLHFVSDRRYDYFRFSRRGDTFV